MAAAEIVIRNFKIQPGDIVYIKAIVESYEGMAVVRTTEADKQVIEILIAHAFQDVMDRVLHSLQQELSMEEIIL